MKKNIFSAAIKIILIYLGLFAGYFLTVKNKSGLFLFFPHFRYGGADKVHQNIASCFKNEAPWIILSPVTHQNYLEMYKNNSKLINMDRLWQIKYLFYFYLGILASIINKHPKATTFGSNCFSYYKIIPLLKPHIFVADLIHSFGAEFETKTLPIASRFNKRITINKKTILDYEKQYKKNNLPEELLKRIVCIPNKIDVPISYDPKSETGEMSVLYVGRGSDEKRIPLIANVAQKLQAQKHPIKFTFIGDVSSKIDIADYPFCNFLGDVDDPSVIQTYYKKAHCIILLSEYEGFPVVFMEAMAYGVIPISTSVGGIPEHVSHMNNGLLISNSESEENIINEAFKLISQLIYDKALQKKLSEKAYKYALQYFRQPNFEANYRLALNLELKEK